MAQQIILSIYIVGLNLSCDFSIPSNMGVRTAVELVQKIVSEEYCGVYQKSCGKLSLFHARTGEILNDVFSFSQLGIEEGTKLILA